MMRPIRWMYPLLAGGAAAFAIFEGSDLAVAVPAATVAVVAAGLALWDTVRDRSAPAAPTAPARQAPPPAGGDLLLAQGVVGQESVVLLLDRIERVLARPDFPMRGAADLSRVSGLSRTAFLDYLEHRIHELEAPA
jgi:hypothetical protein